jgi:hypothetical protein
MKKNALCSCATQRFGVAEEIGASSNTSRAARARTFSLSKSFSRIQRCAAQLGKVLLYTWRRRPVPFSVGTEKASLHNVSAARILNHRADPRAFQIQS